MMKGNVWHYPNTDITRDHDADAEKIRRMRERHHLSARPDRSDHWYEWLVRLQLG